MRLMVPRPRHPRPPRRFLAAIAAVVLIAGCSGPTDVEPTVSPAERSSGRPPDVRTGDPVRIAFLGDSLTAGFGLPESEAFPALVGRTLRSEGYPVEILNAGVSGDTSAGGLARLDWVLRSDPDVLVVELGANDALRGQRLDATERNLREIVSGARRSGARVLLVGMDVPTNYGPEYAGAFAALYPRIADDLGVPFVPAFVRDVGLDPGLMQPDGLHPTARGHRALAETLVPHLRALLPGAE